MPTTDLGLASASELLRLYRSGQASPIEATRAALARIDRHNAAVNAYVHVDSDGAMAAARASEARWQRGAPLSEVDGVPSSIKDLAEVTGMPARAGSLTTSDARCDYDSPPADFMKRAGAVILGKTNTPEFGWKGVTDNRVFGATGNPWNPDKTAGGSSGGAASAAALNMGVLHQGSDSGGSIRIPAGFCGVFGFKPTFGWVPQWPPSKSALLASIGPLTRHAEDGARMLNVIGRHHPDDLYSRGGQPADWGTAPVESLAGVRIAYSRDLGFASVDPQIAAAIDRVAAELRALGAEIIEADPGIDEPIDIYRKIWFTGARVLWEGLDADQRELLDPGLAENARRAEAWASTDLFQAMDGRVRLGAHMARFFQGYDMLLTPTLPLEAFAVNHQVPPDSDMHDWQEWANFSYPFNLTGQPGVSVPCGFSTNGLPISFQLTAERYQDVAIMQAARAYMDAHPPTHPNVPGADPAI
ncbi:amidase [Salinisphaera japonica]|uniref:Amidase n=1 Tax=Salinisphaera japonica YTM-1 TaxID=1209778 RepID=A0A423PGY1_9GAMM|nr:amidase [Salinisphaera japonica]ROO24871.1 amidase [Salinisphaera japonica YTM-1]